MTTIYAEFEWVFDDVQLGIDLKFWRLARDLSQAEVGALIGEKGGWISQLEGAHNDGGMPVRKFAKICTLINAAPENYICLQRK